MIKLLKRFWKVAPKDLVIASFAVLFVLILFFISCRAKAANAVVEFGFGFEPNTPTFGANPYGDVFVGFEFLPCLEAGYQHHSSVADQHDRNVLDGLVIKARVTFSEKGMSQCESF